MLYPYLELEGYSRISLRGKRSVKIRFDAPLQQILGDNGSGKSSLLEQISPLPPNPHDFEKPGHKIIHVLHQGKTYILANVFAKDPKYVVEHQGLRLEVGNSFFLDGVDLNPGGTQTVQRDLARDLFNITPDVHAMLLGDPRFRFTRMNAAKRKECILQLCDTDYDYAIKAYNKLKEKHRDMQGAIKLAKKRLVLESEKLLQSDEEKRLREETQSLHNTLNVLLEMRKPIEQSVDQIQHTQEQRSRTLLQLSKELEAIADFPFMFTQLDRYPDFIEGASRTHAQHQGLLNHFSEIAHAQSEKIEVLRRAEAQSIETLEYDIAQIDQKVAQAPLVVPQLQDVGESHAAFSTLKNTLMDIFLGLRENPERKYSGQALQEARQKLDGMLSNKANLVERLAESKAKLKHQEHHKSHPDLRCPKCSHDFSAHYDINKHEMYKGLVDADELKEIPKVNAQIQEQEEFIEACREYGTWMRQYTQLQGNSPSLSLYWQWLLDQDFLYTNPARGVQYLQVIEEDLNHQLTVQTLTADKTKKEGLLQALRKVGGDDLQALLKAHEQTLEKIEVHTHEAAKAHYDHANASGEFRSLQNAQRRLVQLKAAMRDKRGLLDQEVETLRRTHFNGAIRQLQSALAAREHRLNSLSEQHRVVEAAKSQLLEYEKDEKALALLVSELSPTEGIIAEGLMGFLRRFVGQMNALIEQVWSYDLVIQTCNFSEGDSVDLDYSFPFLANNDKRDDVSKGSTGMMEIFDFAWMMISKKYRHLANHPIFLDEFSKSMDVTHRQNTVMLIKALLEQQAFSQIFMISHDFAQYSSLTHAQVCVLSPNNVVTPQSYNEHVVFG